MALATLDVHLDEINRLDIADGLVNRHRTNLDVALLLHNTRCHRAVPLVGVHRRLELQGAFVLVSRRVDKHNLPRLDFCAEGSSKALGVDRFGFEGDHLPRAGVEGDPREHAEMTSDIEHNITFFHGHKVVVVDAA